MKQSQCSLQEDLSYGIIIDVFWHNYRNNNIVDQAPQ